MKKIILSVISLLFLLPVIIGQVDKTQLSIDIKAKYQKNFEQISQYTWQRETRVFVNDVLKVKTISSVSIGPDGKPVAQVIEKTSGKAQILDEALRLHVDSALRLVSEYVFMSQEQMIELFNTGNVSVLNDNLQVQAFNFFVEGDNLEFLYKKNTLNCVQQTVNTLMNGEVVKALVEYKTLDELNMVRQITLDLPAKGVHGVVINSKWAKKL